MSEVSLQEGPSPEARLKKTCLSTCWNGWDKFIFLCLRIFFILLPRMKNEDKTNTIQIQEWDGNWENWMEIGKLGNWV